MNKKTRNNSTTAKKFLGIVPLLVFAALLLSWVSSCENRTNNQENKTASASSVHKEKKSDIKLALVPLIDCLPIYYAHDSGLFDTLRLSVSLTTFNSQIDCDTAITGGNYDLAYTDLIRANLLGKGKKASVTPIVSTDGRWGVVSFEALRIKKPSQLMDRMVVVSRLSQADALVSLMLKKNGLPEDQVLRPQVNDLFLRSSMLDEGQIDACVLPEPQLTAAISRGHKLVWNFDDENLHLGAIVKIMGRKKGKSVAADKIKTFLKAYNIAVDSINKGGKAVCSKTLQKTYKLTPEALAELKLPKFHHADAPRNKDAEFARSFIRSRGATKF